MTAKTKTRTQAGLGPVQGWYSLKSLVTKGKWSTQVAAWHYRLAPLGDAPVGRTACGAHSSAGTASRTDCKYEAKVRVPKAAPVCPTCARTLAAQG